MSLRTSEVKQLSFSNWVKAVRTARCVGNRLIVVFLCFREEDYVVHAVGTAQTAKVYGVLVRIHCPCSVISIDKVILVLLSV